ncbi:MAG TPA: palindromic element RPE5 domain-containing protein [Rickettsia endosymbiont of Pyrocoelia pectoralis]|nr:palindromic element RPE5 domain-containing protein [Rickettsia endosymbiont of Pyrocoelia pectoralis]
MEKSKESVSRGAERTIVREHPKVYKATKPIFQIQRVYNICIVK